MKSLEPLIAAKLADGVYGIREDNNVARGIAGRGVSGLNEFFDIGSAVIAQGVSGMGPVSKASGFALVLQGKGSRQGEIAVVARGTATGYDWLSNLNVTTDRGPSGYKVHAGFKKVFSSVDSAINDALKGKNPSRIHCVGHSLGGAVANLAASKLAGEGHGVSLYTFGAPRVGMQDMAQYLVTKLGEENIHRVYNPSDVVPMIPIHPFLHAPTTRDGLRVKTGGSLFSLNAHYMSSYTPAVANMTWKSLAAASTATPLHISVDQWIDKAEEYVKIPGSSMAMWALGHALKGLMELARVVGAATYIVGSTVVDIVASMLMKAVNLSKAIGEKIMRWVGLVMKYAGKAVNTGKNITQAFLQWVLELLMRPLISLAWRAIENGMRGY